MGILRFRVQTEEGLKRDKLALFIFIFSIISILLQVSLILTATANLPPQIPLFYSKPWGEQMLAAKYFIWILPAICAFVTILNFSLGIFVLSRRQFLERVLYAFVLIIAISTLYDCVKIISLLT